LHFPHRQSVLPLRRCISQSPMPFVDAISIAGHLDEVRFRSRPKVCPSGHTLKRLNIGYVPGTCDGCKERMKPKAWVMDCRECNYYLCQWCCPLEGQEAPSTILTSLTKKAAQEIEDLRTTTSASCLALAPLAACGAVSAAKRASDAEEISVLDPQEIAASYKACSSYQVAAQPAKQEEDKDQFERQREESVDAEALASVDLLGLDLGPESISAKVVVDESHVSNDWRAMRAGA